MEPNVHGVLGLPTVCPAPVMANCLLHSGTLTNPRYPSLCHHFPLQLMAYLGMIWIANFQTKPYRSCQIPNTEAYIWDVSFRKKSSSEK